MSYKADRFDPFKVFEVHQRPCTILDITVLKGYNITKGWAKDLVDTPDPYVILSIKTSPSGWQKTTVKDNDIAPEWNETFTFYLDPDFDNSLEITLMDANYVSDELLSLKTLSLASLPLDETITHMLKFNDTSEVEIEMRARIANDPQLCYSLALCDNEKRFLEVRRRKVFDSMREILQENGPRNLREVPVVAVLGSGGGFRAMTSLCGVMAALVDSKILDMVTYVAGLSGSAWYVSQLYSHPDWPNKSPNELKEELKENIQSSPFWLLNPQSMYRYVLRIIEKKRQGQPVSFTDLFGHLVGETLLKQRMDTKLTDQQKILKTGDIPMPLYSCLHVKKHVSAMTFHEWMEFSPFEIGLPKYATFMNPELFGSKFFMGQLVKRYPEHPLHFLQGIWGSAFCIQFKHLLKNDVKVDTAELMRREREELVEELHHDMDQQSDEDSDTSDPSDAEPDGDMTTTTTTKSDSGVRKTVLRKPSLRKPKSVEKNTKTFWSGMLETLFDSTWLKSIGGRAAMVHNFMRGLFVSKVYPYSPFSTQPNGNSEEDQFDGLFEMYPTSMKKLYVVDGGLTLNSPFPPMLRPQRGVDLFLSFDFSARPSDSTPPFKELLLVEKWAQLNQVPFPPIDPSVVDREGLKECYVFKDPRDPHCPIVMHFCLVNITFRDEKMPGVQRETDEEREFADFDVFDDPERPYSTFNFKYTNKSFDRLTQLTEFNTLLYKDLILRNIRDCIRVRRKHSVRRPIKLMDIKKLCLKDKFKEKKLEDFVRSLDLEEPPI